MDVTVKLRRRCLTYYANKWNMQPTEATFGKTKYSTMNEGTAWSICGTRVKHFFFCFKTQIHHLRFSSSHGWNERFSGVEPAADQLRRPQNGERFHYWRPRQPRFHKCKSHIHVHEIQGSLTTTITEGSKEK